VHLDAARGERAQQVRPDEAVQAGDQHAARPRAHRI
jgi:hypothetical protein